MTEETAAPKQKKKKRTNATQLTVKEMRSRGYLCAVVEKRIPHMPNITQDLFGFIDILCLGDNEIIGVQATGDNGGNVSSRIKKIADHDNVGAVRKSGMRLLVHGWKKGKDGKYLLREVDVS